jgi:hypothetical protein
MKNILFTIFKLGAIPASIWSAMKEETILLFDEGCKATVTYHQFRTKGKYFSHKSNVFLGFIILTKKRLLGYAFKKRIINFDSNFQDYEMKVEKENRILFRFQAESIIPNSSGTIEIRYHTPKAEGFYKAIRKSFQPIGS